MLIALHYCRKDQQQAAGLAAWLDELGPFLNHDLLITRDYRAERAFPMEALPKTWRSATEIIIRDDTTDAWPFSANHAFKRIGKHIQHTLGAQAFLYLEPDCVILRASAFDEVWAEYQRALAAGKRFVGQLIDQRGMGIDSPPHMSGIGVYAADLVQHAGIAYQAENVPWDIVAGPTIVPQMMQSELILHNWKGSPFESWADVERRIFAVRPKCAVYHSDKSGSLLGLLRERKPSEHFTQPKGGENYAPPLTQTEPTSQPESSAETTSTSIAPVTSWETSDRSTTCSWNAQTPWDSKPDSIAEIRQLADRLMQFSDSSPHVRLVRAELHDAGVIRLSYRFKKRRGWKRKKGKP